MEFLITRREYHMSGGVSISVKYFFTVFTVFTKKGAFFSCFEGAGWYYLSVRHTRGGARMCPLWLLFQSLDELGGCFQTRRKK